MFDNSGPIPPCIAKYFFEISADIGSASNTSINKSYVYISYLSSTSYLNVNDSVILRDSWLPRNITKDLGSFSLIAHKSKNTSTPSKPQST